MIEYPLFPRDVCPDQWWPDVDDSYPDECTDQRHPPDMPDAWGWDMLSANPGRDVIEVVKRLMEQSGMYMIWSRPHQKGKSDHLGNTDISGFNSREEFVDEWTQFSWTDPTVETPQTKADILAWKKKQGKGPAKNWFTKRGR